MLLEFFGEILLRRLLSNFESKSGAYGEMISRKPAPSDYAYYLASGIRSTKTNFCNTYEVPATRSRSSPRHQENVMLGLALSVSGRVGSEEYYVGDNR
jgi:hypothetical protein